VVDFRAIPKDELARLHVRIHPGFQRLIALRRAETGLTIEEIVHTILLEALGDPEPLARTPGGRRRVATPRTSRS
jgi:hypothetical protein